MEQSFLPLLFGGDINVYSVARAFHEAYGVCPEVYGKFAASPCRYSGILHYHVDPNIEQPEVFRSYVRQYAEAHPDKKILVMGCGDSYVKLASGSRGLVPENVVLPYISIEQMEILTHKERFYDLCRAHGLDYPATFVHRQEIGHDFTLPFSPPYIIKPSNGVEYWAHPFPIQNKVYTAHSIEELHKILDDIYGSGYSDSIIIQDFIPGDDTYMRVLTNYSDHTGKVRMMALGHVLLEEHSPHGIGNHAVILLEQNKELCERLRGLLEEIGFVGFSNFDIKYDRRDGKYKLFEINVRQGRSNYYVTGAGYNIAQLVVKDYILGESLPFTIADTESLWMVIPSKAAFRYIEGEEYHAKMRSLIRKGSSCNPLFYKKDRPLKQHLWVLKNHFRYFSHYKKYPKNGGNM